MKNQWKLMDLPMMNKTWQNMQKMQYRHPPIQEHLVYSHLICMYMVVDVHNYSAYIYICVCIMPFLEVTILFNQHFIIVENIVGKSLTGILTLFI